MDKSIRSRVLQEANHIIDTKDTIRKTADKFNVSKSTVYTDLSIRLKEINSQLQENIQTIFNDHDKTKHIRGGEVTKEKYKRG